MEGWKMKALKKAGGEATIELAKIVPGVGSLIEGIRKYHESIEEDQRSALLDGLLDRIDFLEAQGQWYQTEDGREFVRKIVATCLNAEHSDKIDYLANALVNGPTVCTEQATRMKLVEVIRHASRPALDVLGASLNYRSGTGEVLPGEIAKRMGWKPEIVDACVRELYAVGAFSSVLRWSSEGHSAESFSEGTPGVSEFTDLIGEFVADPRGC